MPAPRTKGRSTPSKKQALQSKDAPRNPLVDWRHVALDRMRALIREADPDVIEEQKWKKPSNPAGVPVWSHNGIMCTGEIYKDKVKLTFMHGAALPDPSGLFNAPGTGGTRRAIDIREGEKMDAVKLKALIRAAAVFNSASKGRK